MIRLLLLPGLIAWAILSLTACGHGQPGEPAAIVWTPQERAQIASLWIGRLPPPPADPTNRHADDPKAFALGRKLFVDPQLSANGQIACVSCHQPQRFFTDGLPTARGLGNTTRNAPSLVGVAYSPWQFRDGRADSLWSQVLGPLEDPREMGLARTALAHVIDEHYREEYEALFAALPKLQDVRRFPAQASPAGDAAAKKAWAGMQAADRDAVNRVVTNVGKALEAYERSLVPTPSRFDQFAERLGKNDAATDRMLSDSEQRGLRLFLGNGQCMRCHHGPLLTNQSFHNTGLEPLPSHGFDPGRALGVRQLLASEFNCRGPYNDAPAAGCPNLDFVRDSGLELRAAFRTPSLRNVAGTGPYMHDGRFKTLAEVLDHYNRAPALARSLGHTELFPLGLEKPELADLEAFLRTLSSVETTNVENLAGRDNRD